MLQSAVERQLGILGEAVARLARLHPSVAARISDHEKIIGLRNILVHGYAEVDPQLIWDAVEHDLRRLHAEVEALLGEQ